MNVSPIGEKEKIILSFPNLHRKENTSNGLDGLTYSANGRFYRDIESLWKEPIEDICKDVQITTDCYGEKVLKTYTQIPTFDSNDREWDSKELEFLFCDGNNIHLIVVRGGYRIAKMIFYENLRSADIRMKSIFNKLNWPVDNIECD